MPIVKRIVCLANSRKLHGRCLAGREWDQGQAGRWIRPIGDREQQDVSEYERQYEDGSDPRLLDVINVPLLGPRPSDHQAENWLLDPTYYWERVGKLSWFDLPSLVDPIEALWLGGDSSYDGLNDRVWLEAARGLEDSLRLIHLETLHLSVFRPGEAFGNAKRRVQGRFRYAGVEYWLWVTDPVYERRYLAKLDGDYQIGECYLTVSLGEPFGDACHKLIAAVISEGWGDAHA